MRRTGQSFDINPDTFTLANVFAMDLYRYQNQISEILSIAIKEMSIEKVRPLLLLNYFSLLLSFLMGFETLSNLLP